MVLEAVAAFGLAANILQFIEFSTKLLRQTQKISSHGSSAELLEINTVAENLKHHCQNLSIPVHSITPALSRRSDVSTAKDVAHECKKIVEELLCVMDRLRIPHGSSKKINSFVQALRITWKNDKIQDLQRRMGELRLQLLLDVQINIEKQMTIISASLEDLGSHIKDTRHQTSRVILNLETLLASLEKSATESSAHIAELLSLRSKTTTESLHFQGITLKASLEDYRRKVTILSCLRYSAMGERKSRIPAAHQETFNWIFDSQRIENSTDTRMNFVTWLSSDEQVFWVAGKPGSGKSTLMKFLQAHPITLEKLRSWSVPGKLVTAQFYSWNAGTEIQKSFSGLIMSLLFEVLSKLHHLIPAVLPQEWSDLTSADSSNFYVEGPKEISELKAAFQRLVHEVSQSNDLKFCFFIDGLDEYNGEPEDAVELIRELVALSTTNLKFCISSRPWPAFEDAFGEHNDYKFYLEDLTEDDIHKYVYDHLFLLLQSKYNPKESEVAIRLVNKIIRKARGVFLWVFLVVRSVKRGVKNGDSWLILERRVSDFPSELYDFFEHMFNSTESVYRHQSAILFNVALYHSGALPLAIFNILMGDDFETSSPQQRSVFSFAPLDHNFQLTKRRLHARCHELLWIYSESSLAENQCSVFSTRVDFLHRTVRDFLHGKGISNLLESILGPQFDVSSTMCRALLVASYTCDYMQKGYNSTILQGHSLADRLIHLQWIQSTDDYCFATLCAELATSKSTTTSGDSKSIIVRKIFLQNLGSDKSRICNEFSSFLVRSTIKLYRKPTYYPKNRNQLRSTANQVLPLLLRAIDSSEVWIETLQESPAEIHPTVLSSFLGAGADPNSRTNGILSEIGES